MKHYYSESHFLLRLLLCAVLICPLAAFAQTETQTKTPVIELTTNTDGTNTLTATFKAVDGTPTYVTRGAGYYPLNLSNYDSNTIYWVDRQNITQVIIDSSMKDQRPTSTANWFSNWGG